MHFSTTWKACLTAVLALSPLTNAANFTNPLREFEGSDPHIVTWDGYYYLMTTTFRDLQITRAKTLEGLKTGERITVFTDTTEGRNCNIWAPELHYLDGTWYIYYTASGCANLDNLRPHVLKGGADPFGTYSYENVMTSEWGLDGSIVRFQEWGNYFIFSCLKDTVQKTCITPLLSPTSTGTVSVISSPDETWERSQHPVQEGPVAMYWGGKTYIAYSASFCATPDYAIGLLTWNGGDPTQASSWSKTGPHFSSANGNYGTAHNGFFVSPDGSEMWNVYHATTVSTGACDGRRSTMAQRVYFNQDGTPDFGKPVTRGVELFGPSGEDSW